MKPAKLAQRARQRPDHRAVADPQAVPRARKNPFEDQLNSNATAAAGVAPPKISRKASRYSREVTPGEVQRQMIEEELGRCVATRYPGATASLAAAKLSGGASQRPDLSISRTPAVSARSWRRAPPGWAVLALRARRRARCRGHADAVSCSTMSFAVAQSDACSQPDQLGTASSCSDRRRLSPARRCHLNVPARAADFARCSAGRRRHIHGLSMAKLPSLRQMTAKRDCRS